MDQIYNDGNYDCIEVKDAEVRHFSLEHVCNDEKLLDCNSINGGACLLECDTSKMSLIYDRKLTSRETFYQQAAIRVRHHTKINGGQVYRRQRRSSDSGHVWERQ